MGRVWLVHLPATPGAETIGMCPSVSSICWEKRSPNPAMEEMAYSPSFRASLHKVASPLWSSDQLPNRELIGLTRIRKLC